MTSRVESVVLPALVSRARTEIGGTAAYVIELEKRLRARGVRVTLLGFGAASDEGENFLPVVRREHPRARHLIWSLWRNRGRWTFPPETVIHLQRPDQALGFIGGPWPLVVSIHGCHRQTLSRREGRGAGWVYQRLVDRLMRRADALLFETRLDLEGMAPEGSEARARCHLVPLGVDRDVFQPGDQAEARRRLGLPEGVQAVGYLGRLETEKNVGALLEAVALVPDVELWVAGKGARAEELTRMAGPRVRFLGFLPSEEVPIFLRACDALALSSHNEGLATVVLQAWAVGRPVVVPPVGDFPDLLDDGGGVLATDNSPARLAEAIQCLYRDVIPDAERRRSTETALRARSRLYDWECVADQVQAVYDAALSRRSAR